jgi:hypothetical protein
MKSVDCRHCGRVIGEVRSGPDERDRQRVRRIHRARRRHERVCVQPEAGRLVADGGEPAIDGDLLDDLEQILAGRGRESAITSSKLADRLDINDGEASPKTREAVRILLMERRVPVRSGPCGYWICQSTEEAREYVEDLDGRIAGIEQRQTAFKEAWINHDLTGGIVTDGGDRS